MVSKKYSARRERIYVTLFFPCLPVAAAAAAGVSLFSCNSSTNSNSAVLSGSRGPSSISVDTAISGRASSDVEPAEPLGGSGLQRMFGAATLVTHFKASDAGWVHCIQQ